MTMVVKLLANLRVGLEHLVQVHLTGLISSILLILCASTTSTYLKQVEVEWHTDKLILSPKSVCCDCTCSLHKTTTNLKSKLYHSHLPPPTY